MMCGLGVSSKVAFGSLYVFHGPYASFLHTPDGMESSVGDGCLLRIEAVRIQIVARRLIC